MPSNGTTKRQTRLNDRAHYSSFQIVTVDSRSKARLDQHQVWRQTALKEPDHGLLCRICARLDQLFKSRIHLTSLKEAVHANFRDLISNIQKLYSRVSLPI